MNINFQISPSSVTENCTSYLYEPQLDGSLSLVQQVAVPAPHTSPVTISYNGVDKITHVVKLIGDTTGVEYHKYDVPPRTDIVNIFDFIRFKIGDGGANTPTVGETTYSNPIMSGFTAADYVAIRSGYGPVYEGVEIVNNTAGGFDFFDPTDVFTDKEEWTIIPKPSVITTAVNDSVVGKLWGPTISNSNMYVDVSGSVIYNPAHLRKLIRLDGTNAIYKFGTTNIPPIGYIFRITSYGSYNPAINTASKVQFLNAACKYGNATISEINVPIKTAIECVWDGTLWNLTLSPTPPTPPTFYKNTVVVGDVISLKTITVTIPNQGNNTYHVGLTVVSNGSAIEIDNRMIICIKDKTNTSFKVQFNEVGGGTQNISLDYLITNF